MESLELSQLTGMGLFSDIPSIAVTDGRFFCSRGSGKGDYPIHDNEMDVW
jgi:hypothetical protein